MTAKTNHKTERKIKRKSHSLSQKEIIRRINKSTRNSYKYFDLLIQKGGLDG